MQKLDRLGWAAGTCIVSHGLRIGIRVNDAGVLEQLRGSLPPGWKPARTDVVDRLYSLRVGVGGYPTHPGNTLQVELAATGENLPLPCAPVGERWHTVELLLPTGWSGQPVTS